MSESRLNLAISSVDEVVWDFDLANRNYYVSDRFEEVISINYKDNIKSLKDWLLRIHSEDRTPLLEKMRSHVKGESPSIWAEYRIKDDNGQWQWIQTRAKIVERNRSGSPVRVVGTHANITHYKKLHEELVATENRYRTLFLMANDPILIVGKNGLIVDANIKAATIFGYTSDSIIGQNITDLCSKDDNNSVSFTELFTSISNIIPNNRYELTMLRNKTEPFPVEANIAPVTDLGENLHQVVIHDLALQRRFEREKINAVAEMEERERQRLASNLHDDVGPLLASLNMYLSLLANHKGNSDELVANMQDILRDAIASVREISHNLSPQNLITHGLVVALDRHFQRYNNIINIHFSQNIDNRRIPKVIEITCYSVVKELLNNTIKYAEASNINVKLFIETSNLLLSFTHDGKGFDIEREIQRSKGIGLTNIIERLKSIKANYRFSSEPSKGLSFQMSVNILE
ncbi:MAG: PAS domain S-box protein [Bacteroidota bacterium]